jgi:hypothetical protein
MDEVAPKVVLRVLEYSGGVRNMIKGVQSGFKHIHKVSEGHRNILKGPNYSAKGSGGQARDGHHRSREDGEP